MEGYMKIPNDIRYSSELTPTEKMMLGEILCWSDDTGWSDVTSAYLAHLMGFSIRRAKQMVADLGRRGWIETDRAANRRRLKVTVKALPEGEKYFTVKNISPCTVKETSPSTVKNISPHNNIINNNQPSIQPRVREVVEVEDINEMARKVADEWSEQGRMQMHRVDAKADLDLWPAVVLDTAQWLFLERSNNPDSEPVTERVIRQALTNPRIIRRAIKNIKDQNGGTTTTRKGDINSDAAIADRREGFLEEFAGEALSAQSWSG